MRTIFTILFVITATFLTAQMENPFGVIHHSSRDAAGNLHLRWLDTSEGMGQTNCYYNSNNGIWNVVSPTQYEPGTMEALVPYSFGEKLRYRLHYSLDYMGESIAMLHSAFWDAESFPPALNKMAMMGTDPIGDSLTVYSPNLDLTDAYVASTQQKLYCSLKNLSGNYPTMNSISSYNIYLAMITNPEAASDSVAYAMVYSFNIPGLISNGLYKIGYDAASEMPVFTRLGNIQAQASAGTLHLACNFSDLAADPEFGGWPNASQSLMLVCTTMTADIDLPTMTPTIGLGDYGIPSVVVFQDNVYQVTTNTLPVLSVQNWDNENKILSLSYFDQDGDFPLLATVDPISSSVVQAYPLDPLNPANTIYLAQLPQDWDNYNLGWSFSDNAIDLVNGTYSPSSSSDNLQVAAPLVCSLPNPFRIGSAGAAISLKGLDNSLLKVDLYNLKGQKLESLYSGRPSAPEMNLNWDGIVQGRALASGVYFLRLENGKRNSSHKFVVVK